MRKLSHEQALRCVLVLGMDTADISLDPAVYFHRLWDRLKDVTEMAGISIEYDKISIGPTKVHVFIIFPDSRREFGSGENECMGLCDAIERWEAAGEPE